MANVFLLILLLAYPVRPDTSFKFNNISISQALSAARAMGVKLELPDIGGKSVKIEGRIVKLTVEIRGQIVYVHANGFNLSEPGEPWIRWLKLYYNRKTDQWYAQSEMLGGLVEASGVVLPSKKAKP